MPEGGVFATGAAAGPFGRRQRDARGARLPVLLVTGFLGAGKTTLVRRFLESAEGAGSVVIVNEFGEIGLDNALLAPAAEAKVALLRNGCLCCAVRSDLESTIQALLRDRARGAVPPFRRLVLELSGADDPAPILQTFLSERALARDCHLEAIVAVVDAATGARALASSPEARRQIAVADRLVLSKPDLADEAARAALAATLAAMNPGAPLALAQEGEVAPGFLLAPSLLPAPSRFAAEAVHSAELASFTIGFERPLAWRAVTAAFAMLADLRGDDLLRAKGLLAIEGCEGPVVLHAVRHLLHRPMELGAWPDGTAPRLVFITQNGLGRAPVEALFRAAEALSTTTTQTGGTS
jgi:G3E family GTPase